MAKILVHITTGPDNPTKAALAFLVASTALKEGHTVCVFIAGDGVSLLKPDVSASLEGVGTGRLKDHLEKLKTDLKIYVSGMSAKARGLDESILNGYQAEFAMPDTLVRLTVECDRVLCY